jgi:hypothetical protein
MSVLYAVKKVISESSEGLFVANSMMTLIPFKACKYEIALMLSFMKSDAHITNCQRVMHHFNVENVRFDEIASFVFSK